MLTMENQPEDLILSLSTN